MGTRLAVILQDIFVLEAQCAVCLSLANVGSHAYAPSAPFSHYISIEFKIKTCCYNQILKL